MRGYERVGMYIRAVIKGILVDADSYFQEQSRYVVLNPLRAGRVKQLRHRKYLLNNTLVIVHIAISSK